MAIRDKDGTIYKLRGPNPLTSDQNFWDYKKVRVVNMSFETISQKDKRNPKKIFLDDYDVRDIGEELGLVEGDEDRNVSAREFIEDIQQAEEPQAVAVIEEPPSIEEPEPIIEEPEDKIPIFYADDRTQRFIRNNTIKFWCVPVIWKETKDELYEEVRRTRAYGKKFQFDGIIVTETDFVLQFWSTRELSYDSVIYPQDKGKRCWRIESKEEKTGGWLMSAFVADVNPDFS